MRGSALALATAALLAACGGGDERDSAATEGAGWRTWVLAGPGAIAVPGPPAEGSVAAAADERATRAARRRRDDPVMRMAAARWAVRPSIAPWQELAMRFVSQRAKDPPAGSRAYALVGIASYDAAVAAAHWQSRFGRDGFPSAEAALAAASAEVLAAAFPEHPRARLEAMAAEAADVQVARGTTTRAGADAGLRLGRETGRRVAARAQRDGIDPGPSVPLPAAVGSWRPPPGSTARPVQPDAGGWTTFLLPAGDAVRPPPPPAFGTDAFREQARAVVRAKERLTPDQERIARFWEGGDGTELPPGIWVRAVLAHLRDRGIDGVRAARAMALVTAAMGDAGVAAWDAKYAYWNTRPENAVRALGMDRRWTPLLKTPFFPAYPSGHATYSGAAGEVLASLFPEQARTWRARAEEAAMSRVYGGIHYPMDGEAGLEMGRRIGRLAVQRAQRDGADA